MTDFDHSRSREFGYFPYRPPEKYSQEYIENELRRIGAVLDTFGNLQSPVFNAEPDRPRDGMIRYADGTNWDPTGDGEGYYGYWGGAWHFFGVGASGIPDLNRAVGGTFRFWQCATSLTGVSGFNFHWPHDRFSFYIGGSSVYTLARSTEVPHAGVPYSIKCTCTTGESWQVNDIHYLRTIIAQEDVLDLKLGDSSAEKIYISFWGRASSGGGAPVGDYSFVISNAARTAQYLTDISYSSTTWTKYVISIDGPTIGTWSHLYLRWVTGCHSNHQTSTVDQWANVGTGIWGTTTQDLIGTSGFLQIADVRVGRGPLEPMMLPPELELSGQKRFYAKSYDLDVLPGATDSNGSIVEHATRNVAGSMRGATFQVEMYSNPTVTIYAPTSGNSGKLTNNGDKTATAAKIGTNGFGEVTITTGDTANDALYHWEADARL